MSIVLGTLAAYYVLSGNFSRDASRWLNDHNKKNNKK